KVLQHVIQQVAQALAAAIKGREGAAELFSLVIGHGHGRIWKELIQFGRRYQQAAMPQLCPSFCMQTHALTSGKRISMVTGNTWASPRRAKRRGSTCSRMRIFS